MVKKGTSNLLSSVIIFFSGSPNSLSTNTNNAKSMVFIADILFWIRFSPNSPSSSIPAVSIITTGPIPFISMLFLTGSVVVPATSETIAKS